MQAYLERVGGLDVHKATVVACVRVPDEGGGRVAQVRSFGTMTADLLTLRDWLEGHGVTHVAMESTGVYWKPVYWILEDSLQCVLVNAAHIARVPGRKTDVKDCEWIAELLEHGLLRGSFVPPPATRDLRDLTRYRKSLIQDRTRAANRLHKVLEDAGLKLAAVATDILGASGRAMLEALVAGTTDAAVLADLARGSLRRKLPRLRQALQGRFRPHHAFLVSRLLADLEHFDAAVVELSQRIEEALAPFAADRVRLDAIPGIGPRTAEVLLAEIGVDMQRFPTAAHLASWAGLCPGNHESAGKRKTGRIRPGNRWLRAALIESASIVVRAAPASAFAARYRRIARRRGHKKAIVAVAHAMLVTAYHLLARQSDYLEPGAAYADRPTADRLRRQAVRTLERQGYRVILEPAA
jgi:transposase